MRPSCAPWLFRPPVGKSQYAYDPTAGFGSLGLGDPTSLWMAANQPVGVMPANVVPWFGTPWITNQVGGTLVKSSTTWGFGVDTIDAVGAAGADVVGFQNDSLSPGGVTGFALDFTWSAPFIFVAPGVSTQNVFTLYDGTTNNSWQPFQIDFAAMRYRVTARMAAANVTPPNLGATLLPWQPTKSLVVTTSQSRAGSRVWQSKIRTVLGTFSVTSLPIVSAATAALPQLRLGGLPPFGSQDLAYGGACCWKNVGASDAQLDAILDHWETLYPLS